VHRAVKWSLLKWFLLDYGGKRQIWGSAAPRSPVATCMVTAPGCLPSYGISTLSENQRIPKTVTLPTRQTHPNSSVCAVMEATDRLSRSLVGYRDYGCVGRRFARPGTSTGQRPQYLGWASVGHRTVKPSLNTYQNAGYTGIGLRKKYSVRTSWLHKMSGWMWNAPEWSWLARSLENRPISGPDEVETVTDPVVIGSSKQSIRLH